MKTKIFLVAVMLLTTALLSQAGATTVLRLTFGEIVSGADVIISGKVLDVESKLVRKDGKEIPRTFVTISKDTLLKGNVPGCTYTFSMEGGIIPEENVSMQVGAMPQFEKNQEVFLFLKEGDDLISPVVGFFQGRFNLKVDEATGYKYVYDNNGSRVTQDFISESSSGKNNTPVTFEMFKSAVSSRTK